MFLKRVYKQEVMVLKESLECAYLFIKRVYKEEVMVLKESLECAIFLKRVFCQLKQEVTLLNKRQKLSLSRYHKVKRVFPIWQHP